MPAAGNQGSSQAADKAIAKAKKLKKKPVTKPAPPSFPTKVPVRPGAQTNRYSKKPSTQAERTHVHEARVARNKQLTKAGAGKDTKSNADLGTAKKYNDAHPVKHKQKASDIYMTDPKALKAAGFKVDKLDQLAQAPAKVPLTLAKSAIYTAETGYKEPKTLARLPGDTAKAALSIPAGIIRSGLHPKQAVKAIAKDYSKRYGGIYSGKKGAKEEFQKRQEKEGILPEVLDVAGAAGAAGASAGRSAGALARTGKLGKGAEEVATTRPALQVSGTAKAQKVSKNLGTAYAQRGVDKVRARSGAKQLRKAQEAFARHEDTTKLSPEVQAAARATEEDVPTVARISRGRTKQIQRGLTSGAKSVAIVRRKVEGQKSERALRRAYRGLDEAAVKAAIDYGIRDSKTATKILEQHAQRIVNERKVAEAKGKDLHVTPKTDELADINKLLKDTSVFDNPKLHDAVTAISAETRRVAEGDPNINAERAGIRRVQKQADLLGIARKPRETTPEFLARVEAASKDAGLQPGEYFPSRESASPGNMERTTGGSTAQAGDKAYTGALTRTGRESPSKEVLINQVQNQIRRKHNWNLVNHTFDTHTFEWSRGADRKGMDAHTLIQHIGDKGIDPTKVSLINLKRVEDLKNTPDEALAGEANKAAFDTPDEYVSHQLDLAIHDPKYYKTHPEDFQGTNWAVVPREVANEIQSAFRGGTAVGRAWRIQKGAASRVLLSNPVWLQFQVMSNALAAGLHGTGPRALIKAHYQFKDPEWKALESDVGIHDFYDERAHLGAAGNKHMIVEGWRAWQKIGAGTKLGGPHPVRGFFNMFHRGDTAQNNAFRRAVLYNDVKRQAYKNMAEDAGHMVTLQRRMMNTLKNKDPEKYMQDIVHNPHLFEQHAKAVDDMLGNWTSYSSRERAILGNVLFGGFLRYSVRLAFYTMPVKHPIMSSILMQMGRMEKDELERIFAKFGGKVPPWEYGNYYSEDGKTKFDAQRMNMFSNVMTGLTQKGVPAALVGLLSPAAAELVYQMANGNLGSGQLWLLKGLPNKKGEPTSRQAKFGKWDDISFADRAKILIGDLARVSPYYRDVEKYGVPGLIKPLRGKQYATSSLVSRDDRAYRQADKIKQNEQLKKEQSKQSWIEGALAKPSEGMPDLIKAKQYEDSLNPKPKTKATKFTFKPKQSGFDWSGSTSSSGFDWGG